MIQPLSVNDALIILTELSIELKKHEEQKRNDAEFYIQKDTIIKIRELLASLDQMFNPRKLFSSMSGDG